MASRGKASRDGGETRTGGDDSLASPLPPSSRIAQLTLRSPATLPSASGGKSERPAGSAGGRAAEQGQLGAVEAMRAGELDPGRLGAGAGGQHGLQGVVVVACVFAFVCVVALRCAG